jgi:hypothetical protein
MVPVATDPTRDRERAAAFEVEVCCDDVTRFQRRDEIPEVISVRR